MPIDQDWFQTLCAMPDLATRDTLAVDGVEIELPVASTGNRYRLRQWQRRVLPDLIPDSVNADAPERTLFRVLYKWTSGQATRTSIEDALTGELAPLEDVFRAQTHLKLKKMTLAFHVLAVKAADKKESDAKGYTERTLLLLCRRRMDGAPTWSRPSRRPTRRRSPRSRSTRKQPSCSRRMRGPSSKPGCPPRTSSISSTSCCRCTSASTSPASRRC